METRQRSMKRSESSTIFVTVGTTQFNPLIETVCDPQTLKVFQMLGYTKLVLQIGKGDFIPDTDSQPSSSMDIEYYRFKPSLKEDIHNADLVISHAGAGSCLETLEAGKKLLVVINDLLMDNHQLELAYQLYSDQHLYYCTCKTLTETLQKEDFSKLKPFSQGKPEVFAAFLDNVMGFD